MPRNLPDFIYTESDHWPRLAILQRVMVVEHVNYMPHQQGPGSLLTLECGHKIGAVINPGSYFVAGISQMRC